jgi:hypothetical protein
MDEEKNYEAPTVVPTKEVVRPSLKYFVLGLLVGAFLMCGAYFLIYILANKLDGDDDFEGVYGTYLIGTIPGKDYGKALYKLQHIGKRTFNFDDSIKLISKRIKMSAQKEGVSCIGILGCGIKKHNEMASNEIIAALKNDYIDAMLIDDPLYDPMSTEMLSKVDRVILLEKIGVTYRTEIWKEIEMIKKFGIRLDGIVISE